MPEIKQDVEEVEEMLAPTPHSVADAALDFWKMVSICLIGVIITGAGAWMVFGGDKVTRSEATTMVETGGPYSRERSLITDSMSSNKAAIDRLSVQAQSVVLDQAKLSTKLDQVLLQLHEMSQDNKRLHDEIARVKGKPDGGGP